jgi:hypothetical protein
MLACRLTEALMRCRVRVASCVHLPSWQSAPAEAGQVVWLLDHWTDVTDDYVGLSFPESFGLPLFLDS